MSTCSDCREINPKPDCEGCSLFGLEEDSNRLSSSISDDCYPLSSTRGDGTVSIEEAASQEHKLKEFFDGQIVKENQGVAGIQIRGERPCVREKHSRV